MLRFSALSAFVATAASQMLPGSNGESMAAIKAELFNPSGASAYDKTLRPSLFESRMNTFGNQPPHCVASSGVAAPDNVYHQFVLDKFKVDQKALSYTLQGFFRAMWTDPRLAFNGTCGVTQLTFPDSSQMWTPDFYFEKPVSVQIPSPGGGEALWVYPDGYVWWSRQATITLSCKMIFGNIPYDVHKCPYELGLYSQTADDVILRWYEVDGKMATAINTSAANSTPTWTLTKVEARNDFKTYAGSGSYTYAYADITIERIDQSYVLAYITLTNLIVLMSYAGFYINPAAAPGRIALGIISTLVMLNLYNAAKSQLPPFSYDTWLTDFLFSAMCFNMTAFFSYALCNFGMQMNAKLADIKKKRQANEAVSAGGIQLVEAGSKASDGALVMGKGSDYKMKLLEWSARLKDNDYFMRYAFILSYFIYFLYMQGKVGSYPSS